MQRWDEHYSIHFIDVEITVYIPHRLACILHSVESLLVDIRGFDGVYLVLEHGNLV